jgi:hypothetical protein
VIGSIREQELDVQGKRVAKSLTLKKGALRKMDRVVKEEREKFGKNLGILEGVSDGGGSRWEMLRTHIKSGMGR